MIKATCPSGSIRMKASGRALRPGTAGPEGQQHAAARRQADLEEFAPRRRRRTFRFSRSRHLCSRSKRADSYAFRRLRAKAWKVRLTGVPGPLRPDRGFARSLVDSGCAKGRFMQMNIVLLQPLVALLFGILILILPRLLNYLIAIYLILIGLAGLFPHLFTSTVST
jgi:hypothetical protein